MRSILEGEFWDLCTVDASISKAILVSSDYPWPSFFLEKVRLSSLYIFPKLANVVIGYRLRRELEKLHQNLHEFGYFQANSATFWQGRRVKVVLLKVLVRVVYWVVGDLDFFGRQKTPKATKGGA